MMGDTISPVPREARRYQGEHAGLVSRLIANGVDVLTVGAAMLAGYAGINGLLFMLDPQGFEFRGVSILLSMTTAAVFFALYVSVAWSSTGRTYGHHLMGLRVVGPRGDRLSPPRAIVRAVLCVVFPIGLLWCAVSRSRRSVQDVLVRTSVIYDWQPHPGSVGPG